MSILVPIILFLIAATIYLACGCLLAFILCRNGKEDDTKFVSLVIFAWPVILVVLLCVWLMDKFIALSDKLADTIIKIAKKNPK